MKAEVFLWNLSLCLSLQVGFFVLHNLLIYIAQGQNQIQQADCGERGGGR